MTVNKPTQFFVAEEATADLARLAKLDKQLAGLAIRMLNAIRQGSVVGVSLQKMPKYGDLSDCRKVYFGYGNPPTHRIVYRITDEKTIEIIEVIAVENRDDAYVYLLAALRLKRLPAESQNEFQSVHQRMIAKRSQKK